MFMTDGADPEVCVFIFHRIALVDDHWFICITHRKKWCIGANLFSSAMDETPEQQQRQQEQLGFESFEVVEPFYGERDANTDRH